MSSQPAVNRGVHLLFSVITIGVLVGALWLSARIALSRVALSYGMATANPAAVDAAVRLTPTDAEGHYGRAELYKYTGQPELALKEFELAISLRPRDYALWLDLGMTRDELGDEAGALACFNRAVELARYYAQPRWQRGNLLFRMGRYDEAFTDLRSAATSNPDLFPNFVDLAWGASRQNTELTEQILQPRGDAAHLGLARFFATHGRPAEGVAHFKLVRHPPDEIRKELIQKLIANAAFKQAFELWVPANLQNAGEQVKFAIYDGGFEGSLALDESGFGWRIAPADPALKLSQDPNQAHSGSRSLRIEFNGNSSPATHIVSQLLLVEPGTNYKLNFAWRGQNIITGGAPVLTVSEAAGERRQLMRSEALAPGTGAWQTASIRFSTGLTTEAIVVALQRDGCTGDPCPIFGSMNLDSFSLERAP